MVNEQYIKTLPADEIAKHLQWHLDSQLLDISNGPALNDVIEAHRDRGKTLKELAATIRYYYEDFNRYDENAAKKYFKTATPAILQKLLDKFKQVDNWNVNAINTVIKNTCEELEFGMGKVGPALRVAVTDFTKITRNNGVFLQPERLAKGCRFLTHKPQNKIITYRS